MIDKQEILRFATALNLPPNTVEKDYILGWLLKGINSHPTLQDQLVFKGGTCLKKCLLETYRFSEDLDFTLKESFPLDSSHLETVVTELTEWVEDNSGIKIPQDSVKIELYRNPRGILVAEVRVGYIGPLKPGGNFPKVKLDLSHDEKIVTAPLLSKVFHPYSDCRDDDIYILSYSVEETFAEKIRALSERARPRDLYDVIHLFHNREMFVRELLLQILQEKCFFKNIKVPTLEGIQNHPKFAELEQEWSNMIQHQVPVLPLMKGFIAELPAFFQWLHFETEPALLPKIHEGEQWKQVSPKRLYEPSRESSIMEKIQFAAANRLCISIRSRDGRKDNLEPYALYSNSNTGVYLHYVTGTTGELGYVQISRIKSVTILPHGFQPRFAIEISGIRFH